MRKSLIEQVKDAKRAYILQLSRSRSGMERRYCVYVDDGEGLEILWPYTDNGEPLKLLDGMVYSTRAQYPAYHFRFGGCGFSATDEIRSTLKAINPSIEVFTINGHSPSSCMI